MTRKARTLKDVEKDPRVSSVDRGYSGPDIHLVILKEGFLCWDAGSIIGDTATIINDVNNHINQEKR